MPPARAARNGHAAENMEQLTLGPLTRASGTVRLPGSKSISNRVLLLSALATGETRVRDLTSMARAPTSCVASA